MTPTFSDRCYMSLKIKVVFSNFLIFISAFCCFHIETRSVHAGIPTSPQITIEESLRNDTDFIFQGHFKRIVWIDKSLYYKLWKRGEPIPMEELVLHEENDDGRSGASFVEVVGVKLLSVHPNNKNAKSYQCDHEKIYILRSLDDEPVGRYLRKLIGKDVILRLSPETSYAVGSANFPQPFFRTAGRQFNWFDGMPLPIEEKPTIESIYKKLGYISSANITCSK